MSPLYSVTSMAPSASKATSVAVVNPEAYTVVSPASKASPSPLPSCNRKTRAPPEGKGNPVRVAT